MKYVVPVILLLAIVAILVVAYWESRPETHLFAWRDSVFDSGALKVGLDQDDVRDILGRPDIQEGEAYWFYTTKLSDMFSDHGFVIEFDQSGLIKGVCRADMGAFADIQSEVLDPDGTGGSR